MNLSFSLEKSSSFSPVPGPVLVMLEPAMEAVVESGAGAASASLRPSVMVAVLGSQADTEQRREGKQSGLDVFSLPLWQMHVRGRACEQLLAQAG